MAETVVDDLEVVEVDEQHGDRAKLCTVEPSAELLQEVGAVRQSGELVMARRPLQVLSGAALIGDVLDMCDRQFTTTAVAHHAHRGVRPHHLAVSAHVPLLRAVARGATGSGGRQCARDHIGNRVRIRHAVVRVGDVHDGPADELIARCSQHPAQRAVDVQQGEVSGRSHRHPGGRGFECDLESRLSLFEAPALGQALPDVPQRDHDLLGVADGRAQVGFHRVRVPAEAEQLEHSVRRLLPRQDPLPHPEHTAPVRLAHEVEEQTAEQVIGLTACECEGELVDLVDPSVGPEHNDRFGYLVEQLAQVRVVTTQRRIQHRVPAVGTIQIVGRAGHEFPATPRGREPAHADADAHIA